MTDETKEIIGVIKDMYNTFTERFDKIDEKITKIETTLENETNKNIKLLSEGYLPMAEDVHQLKDDVEVVKFDVDIVKKVVTTHSTQINQLKKAK